MKPVTSWDSLPIVLDTAYAARVLGCCAETVKRMCQRGELKAVNMGGRAWRVTRDNLRDYVEGNGRRSDDTNV